MEHNNSLKIKAINELNCKRFFTNIILGRINFSIELENKALSAEISFSKKGRGVILIGRFFPSGSQICSGCETSESRIFLNVESTYTFCFQVNKINNVSQI